MAMVVMTLEYPRCSLTLALARAARPVERPVTDDAALGDHGRLSYGDHQVCFLTDCHLGTSQPPASPCISYVSQAKQTLLQTGYFPDDPGWTCSSVVLVSMRFVPACSILTFAAVGGVPLMFMSATFASVFANFATLPADVVKSRS